MQRRAYLRTLGALSAVSALDEAQTVSFEADERKRVTFSVDVPEDTGEVSANGGAA